MFVYILREGTSNHFKIGKTASDNVSNRIRSLQTGNSQELSEFLKIETDQESACEGFFHHRLRTKRVRGGGKEFYAVEPEEIRRLAAEFTQMFQQLKETRCSVEELVQQLSTDIMLQPTEDDNRIFRDLMRNKEEQAFLKFECELLESELKQRIGTAAGIKGVACWETVIRRNFDESIFKERDPDRYEALLEKYHCLDTTTWRGERPQEYKAIQTTYFSPTATRPFKAAK